MEAIVDTLVILGMLLIRIGIPIAITAALAYALRRLDQRWQAEARRARGLPPIEEAPLVAPTAQPALEGQHCWERKGCSEWARANCPAYQHPEEPCWAAQSRALGVMPAECTTCEMYAPGQTAKAPLPAR
jgi:hypothetical protein